VSELRNAIAGVPNAAEPFTDLVTGGQPSAQHLAGLKDAGCEVVIDLRDPMEPRPFDEPGAVRAAGMDYVNIPVSGASMTDETLTRVRDTVANLAGDRKTFLHCGSGNRVGATLMPYLMLDKGMEEDDAVTEAMKIGTRSVDLIEWALNYVRRTRSA